jgi:gluconokinase
VIFVVTGVSGSGKTTVGRLLARRLGWPYAEADEFHPAANVAAMAAGRPLTDAEREPWLAAIGAWIDDRLAAGENAVVTCSGLKRSYRDRLRAGRAPVRLVFLQADPALVGARLAARQGHFFPARLLDSQFEALEVPGPDEDVRTVDVTGTPDEIVEQILRPV